MITTSTSSVPVYPGIEVEVVDSSAFARNPLRSHALVELHDDVPRYPPSWFDADGYLNGAEVLVPASWGDLDKGCWRNVFDEVPCNADVPADDPLGLCPTHADQLRSDA